ncbi:MAG: PD-(D/E)XK nuclease family protein [Planctomycetaceae bacterium]|nr:PD-(D/E)XK nuclease family protein [Planctomycetaceae bacterium]
MPIQREFLDWSQPALPSAADYLIQRYSDGDSLDLSNVILVFPGRRAGRRMLELLVEKATLRWPDLLPPVMVTFDRFPEMLYTQKLGLADKLTQLLVWRHALSCIPARELTAALPHIPNEDAIPAWMALCETLRRQHNELAADGMEFSEIHEHLANSGNRSEADRWKALRRIQAEYLMQMDSLQLWDRQAARLVAVEQNECQVDRDIIMVGTVDMNRIVRRMIDQIADRVTVLIHAPESEAGSFDEHGCLIPAEWESRQLNIPISMMAIVDKPDDQAQCVIQQLSELQGRYRADEVAIGVANDRLVPAILQGLSDAGLSGRWPIGQVISSSRPYRLLEAVTMHLISARDGLPADFASLSDLVRHPDLTSWIDLKVKLAFGSEKSVEAPAGSIVAQTQRRRRLKAVETDWLTTLDKYLADHLQATPGVLLGDESTRRSVGAVCDAVELLLAELLPPSLRSQAHLLADERPAPGTRRKGKVGQSLPSQRQLMLDDMEEAATHSIQQLLTRKRTLIEWADGALRMIATIYRDRELVEEKQSDRAIVECFNAVQSLIESLRQVPDMVMPRTTCVQALQLILRQIGEGNVPPGESELAIDLMGWLELPLDDSPVVILTGFNEGDIPESTTSDVFLPNSFRQQLGLTDNARRYARDAYAMTTLLNNRHVLKLIAGRVDAKGNPVAPSRLWFAADQQSLPQRVRLFYAADKQQSDTGDREVGLSAGVPDTRQSGFVIPSPPPRKRLPDEISVTDFRVYLDCPYRYFIGRELKLRSIQDETRELSAAAFGSLMHEVLNRFGESNVRTATTPEAIELFLLTELQKVAAVRFGRDRSATVVVQLKMLENRLQKFAEWQAGTAKEGWRIVRTEARLEYSHFRDSKDRPVKLIGRIDRIDQHQTTRAWRVLDYKTSESALKPDATHRTKGEWIDLQLPLYRLLVQPISVKGEVQLGYIHLPGDLSQINCSIADWDEETLQSAENKARQVAADILDLRIDRVVVSNSQWQNEFSRLCQDRVIDRNIPWLSDYSLGHED